MKTLTKHIEEKLIINKDFKGCCGVPSEKGGKFLRLWINTRSNSHNNKINIEIVEYKFSRNRFRDDGGSYKQNKKGYYWTDKRLSGYWLVLALIGDDALDFLNTLLKDPTRKFNLFEYFDESQQKLIDKTLRKVYIEGWVRSNDNIEDNIIDFIKKINESIN